jgi:hypothetical protein
MKVFLIIFLLIVFVGGIFWFVASTLHEEPSIADTNQSLDPKNENESDIENIKVATKEVLQDNKPFDKTSDVVVKNTNKESQTKTNRIANEVVDKNADSPVVINDKQLVESEPEEGKKERIKKRFSFVDEKGADLFNGKTIGFSEESIEELATGISLKFIEEWNKNWRIELTSEDYFIDESLNSIFKKNQFTFEEISLQENNKIILSRYAELQIQLKYKEGVKPIPDGTDCDLSTPYLFEEKGKINSGIAIFKIKGAGVRSVTYFCSGSYFKYFNQSLLLNRGQTTSIELEIEIGKDQTFKVNDSLQKPIEGYYVCVLGKGNDNSFNISNLRNEFIKEGKVKVANNCGVTDNEGNGTIRLLSNGEYIFFILGKNHSEQFVNVTVNEDRNQILLVLKDDEKKSLVIKARLNKEAYIKELKFAYSDLIAFGGINKKTNIKITDGQPQINNLKSSKYQFQLDEEDFQRETFEIDFRETDKIEYTIELKISAAYIHGYVIDNKGNPLEGISVYYDHTAARIKTNEKGYFKFSGLDKEKKYNIYLSSDHPFPKDIPKGIYPTQDEIKITLDDIIYIPVTILGVDGKPVPNFSYRFEAFKDKAHKDNTLTSRQSGTNGELTLTPYQYGYYDIIVTLPNLPSIHKQFSVLSKEEIVPIILQAELGFSLTGIVSDFEGNIMPGVSITRSAYNGPNVTMIYDEIMKTNKDGYFKLDNCTIDEKYWFVKVGYAPISVMTKEEDKNFPLKLSFVKTYKLTGTLQTTDKKPHAMIQMVANLKTNRKEEIVTETSADGSFTVNSITPGEWYVYFNIRGLKNKKKPGQWVTISDKDVDVQVVYDIPKD